LEEESRWEDIGLFEVKNLFIDSEIFEVPEALSVPGLKENTGRRFIVTCVPVSPQREGKRLDDVLIAKVEGEWVDAEVFDHPECRVHSRRRRYTIAALSTVGVSIRSKCHTRIEEFVQGGYVVDLDSAIEKGRGDALCYRGRPLEG
jgi:hypothetical protein